MNSLDHLEALQESIGELVSLAWIGKRFIEIAETYYWALGFSVH